MPDARPEHGTPIDIDKIRSIGYLGRGRTRDRITEGRAHPETGRPWKTVDNEAGTVTEHNTRDDRVDAIAKVDTVHAVRTPGTGRITNAQ